VLQDIAIAADEWFLEIDTVSREQGPWSVAAHLPTEARYLPSARSIALPSVVSPPILMAAFTASLKEYLIEELGPTPACDVDLAWLRRQYPPSLRPAVSAPHNWHQDGAYGFDFTDEKLSLDDALVPMLTLWAPLQACGELAPGLELVANPDHRLIDLPSLEENEISKRWPYDQRWRPVMKPGDVLLIKSHVLHRTHVTSHMTQVRSCVELRFFPAQSIPLRMASHTFVAMV